MAQRPVLYVLAVYFVASSRRYVRYEHHFLVFPNSVNPPQYILPYLVVLY